MNEEIILNGKVISLDDFERIKEEVNNDASKRIIEVKPGEYRTIERMRD